MTKLEIRTAFSTRVGSDDIDFSKDPGLTVQGSRDECDINTIMKRWEKTGEFSHYKASQPMYGDFSMAVDYHTALNLVDAAHESFMALPARIRDRFENDPANLLAFLDNPENRDEALALGLLEYEGPVALLSPPDGGASADQSAGAAAPSGAPKGG